LTRENVHGRIILLGAIDAVGFQVYKDVLVMRKGWQYGSKY